MEFDPVGLAVVSIALVMCCFGSQAAICAAFCCLVFTSTAIASLPALGGAPLAVPQFGWLLFAGLGLARQGAVARVTRALAAETAPLLLLTFNLIAVTGAVLLPRIMNWNVDVYSLSRFTPNINIPIPLGPSAGNVTQSLYQLGGMAAFFSVIMAIRNEDDIKQFVIGFKTLVLLQASCACIDVVGKYGFGTDVLAFLRTAKYDLLTDGDIAGVWRIVGTDAETSYLAMAVAGQLAFCFALWRSSHSRFGMAIFTMLTAVLVISTSSSAYVFLALGGGWYLLVLGYQLADGKVNRAILMLMLTLTAMISMIIVGALLIQSSALTVRAYSFVDHLLLDKLHTDSGQERSAWNEMALANVFETYGFGIGLGSSRTSSWALAVVSQTGIIGAALFGIFIFLLIAPPTWRRGTHSSRILSLHRAFQAYIIATIIIASISWTAVYLGATFYIVAGLTMCLSQTRQKQVSHVRGQLESQLR